ncbi:DNA primase [Candidatus Saccharibacteria bacterium]|nr:DNA primase [Candidatus Saccharibacteria bacterium]
MDAAQEVKARINIEDVIGEYVQLKRAGRNFKGLSPFQDEKSPSFVVSPEKQIWHDFSSNRGGDVFTFVMEVEGLDFKGALELLARKAGVELENYSGKSGEASKLRDRLYVVNELAAKFYQVQFSHSKLALEYALDTRGFSKQTLLRFRVGYSPNTGKALTEYLTKQGFTDSEIQKAGLKGKYGDMFRGRLMIPLQDVQGRVIGFTARLLDPESSGPKYINTPATMLYDKSRHVYGLHLAKDMIRKSGYSVLTEGNLDVIASHQAEVTNVVATAGTALTEHQLKSLGRFAPDIRLCFDADKAGIAATERAIPIASRVGVNLNIVTIIEGKDPDELIKVSPKLWEEAIQSSEYALDWLIGRYKSLLDLNTAQGKRKFSDIMLEIIKGLGDPVEQDHYIQVVATETGVGKEVLLNKFAQNNDTGKRLKTVKNHPSTDNQNGKPFVQNHQESLEWAKSQDHLLALTMMKPDLRHELDPIDSDMLPQESAQIVLEYLQANPDFDGKLANAPDLNKIADYVKILSLQYEALFMGLDEVESRYEANRLRVRLITLYVKTKKAKIAFALQTADDETAQKLLTRAKSLDSLLRNQTGDKQK